MPISSDQINARINSYMTGGNTSPFTSTGYLSPQQMPLTYSMHHPPFQLNMADPLYQETGGRMGTHAAQLIGPGLIGTGLAGFWMFPKVMSAALRGASAASKAFGGWEAVQGAYRAAGGGVAGALKAAGTIGIGGGLRVLAGGAISALPYYLAYKGIEKVGSAIYQGARWQRESEAIFRQHLRYTMGARSRFGVGPSTEELRDLTDFIRGMTHRDTLRSKEELMRIVDKLGRRNFFVTTHSVRDFKRKFKNLVSTLKEMARAFGSSLEDAIPLLDAMKRAGITTNRARQQYAYRMMAAGIHPMRGAQVMEMGAAASRAQGGFGAAGAAGYLRTYETLLYAQRMSPHIDRLMTEITGKTGPQARQEVTNLFDQMTLRFARTPLGRLFLAGLMNRQMTGMNQEAVQRLMSGDLSLSEARRMAFRNLSTFRAKARFVNREADLRSAFLQQVGPLGMARIVESALRSRLIMGASDQDIQEIIMKRFTGGNRRTAQLLFHLVKNMDRIRMEMASNTLRQINLARVKAEIGEHYTLKAAKRRWAHELYGTFVEPFEQIGGSIYTWASTKMRDYAMRKMGIATINLSQSAREAFLQAVSGNQAKLEQQFGGRLSYTGMYGSQFIDLDKLTTPPSKLMQFIFRLPGHQKASLGRRLEAFYGQAFLRRAAAREAPVDTGMPTLIFRGESQVYGLRADIFRTLSRRQRERVTGRYAAFVYKNDRQVINEAKTVFAQFKKDLLSDPNKHEQWVRASRAERAVIMRDWLSRNAMGQRFLRKVRRFNRSVGKGERMAALDATALIEKAAEEQHGGSSIFKMLEDYEEAFTVGTTAQASRLIDRTLGRLAEGRKDRMRMFKGVLKTEFSAYAGYLLFGPIGGVLTGILGYQWGREDIRAGRAGAVWLKKSNIFREATPLSEALMRLASGQIKSIQESPILKKIMVAAGPVKIGTKTYSAEEVKQMQAFIRQNQRKPLLTRTDYERWKSAVQFKNRAALAQQLRTAGEAAYEGLQRMRGRYGRSEAFGRVAEFFKGIGTITERNIIEKIKGGALDVFKVFEGMKTLDERERRRFLYELGQTGPGGRAIAAVWNIYEKKRQAILRKGEDTERKLAELRKEIKAKFAGALTHEGATMVGRRLTVAELAKLHTDYIRVNTAFVHAVGKAVPALKNVTAQALKNMGAQSRKSGATR